MTSATLQGPDGRVIPITVDDRTWGPWLDAVQQLMQGQGWHPSRVVVLVPYAQLMPVARRAWAERMTAGFPPRFESTRNWAASLAPFLPGEMDISGDRARDSLVAAAWIDRMAGAATDVALRATLGSRLVDAAQQLAPLAAASPPERRQAWADALRAEWAPAGQSLHWESLVASLALAWAGVSGYPTDVLWSARCAPGRAFDALIVLPGFQSDPLVDALLQHWGPRGVLLPAAAVSAGGLPVLAHPCADAEDEAQRAAACVIQGVNEGRGAVALVAQDRALTRRIGALLEGTGVSVRDETGWRLSTTQAAARLMALLRAADRRARTDDVLDWLKQGPHAAAADMLERLARAEGLSAWRVVQRHPATATTVPVAVTQLLSDLQSPRPLVQWLKDLAQALQLDGWWSAWQADAAGQRILEVLRLREGAAHELAALGDGVAGGGAAARSSPSGRRWPLAVFAAWVRDVLESASFQPPVPADPQVVILPLAQLLGRRFSQVVVPGCDEIHLPTSPEPPGQWTEAERARLGLPGREALAQAARAAWNHLTEQAGVCLLWRSQNDGEVVAASPWLQALGVGGRLQEAADPRLQRSLALWPQETPRPVAADLLPSALSASAYQDLRDCPYRFFALRQLRLQPVDEIDVEPDKRDLGNWLHAVLRTFHEARRDGLGDGPDDRQRLDSLALAEARVRGLMPESDEDGAGFLPFMAAWPALRDGYLAWLAGHEAEGPVFDRAEVSLSRTIGPWRLIGQLDRIDRQATPEGRMPLVIDYKTEPRSTTQERVKSPLEDTQIAFYAALLGDETVRGAYLSITDSRETTGKDAATRWIEQPELLVARECLLQGIANDLGRIAQGHPLPALGEGKVCDFCAARGLCRKDFRT